MCRRAAGGQPTRPQPKAGGRAGRRSATCGGTAGGRCRHAARPRAQHPLVRRPRLRRFEGGW
eukprot:6814179-Prymnesium_polylepis.1